MADAATQVLYVRVSITQKDRESLARQVRYATENISRGIDQLSGEVSLAFYDDMGDLTRHTEVGSATTPPTVLVEADDIGWELL